MTTDDSPALLFAHNDAGVAEMLQLGQYLLATTGRPVILALSGGVLKRGEAAGRIEAAGIKWIAVPMWRSPAIGQRALLRSLLRAIRAYRKEARDARSLDRRLRPWATVFSYMGPEAGFQVAFAHAAQKRGAAVLSIPVAAFDAAVETEGERPTGRLDVRRLEASTLNRVVGRLWPHFVAEIEGQPMLFNWPPLDPIAAKMARVGHRNHYWRTLSGLFTAVAVRSERDRDRMIGLGAPTKLIHVTGRPSDDLVAGFLNEPAPTPEAPNTILCAVPQMMEHGFCDSEEHWRRVHHLLRQLTDLPQAHVSLSLHPRMVRDQYIRELGSYGVQILPGPLVEAIHKADLFVCMASSTIETALAAGIPVLDLQCWLRHTAYDDAAAYVPVFDEDDIGASAAEMLAEPKRGQLHASAKTDAPRWGRLDGRARARITALLNDLSTQ